MIYAVLLVLIVAHAVVVIWLMEIKAKSDEKWRVTICAKENIKPEVPKIKSPETNQAKNLRKWRGGDDA